MQKKDWHKLTDLCRGQYGIVTVPTWLIEALVLASQHLPPPPTEPKPTLQLLLETCQRWGTEPQELQYIERWQRFFAPRPVYHNLTVDDIMIDLANREHPGFDDIAVNQRLKVVWRWEGYPLSLAFYWAFLFHEHNLHLQHPQEIWDRIKGLWHKEVWWPRLCLACYERTLGVRHDIQTSQPHYVKNILEREGLSQEERSVRPPLFSSATTYLLQAIGEELERLSA